MKITALKQQIKNPQRISVFVDGQYSFSLSLDELASEKIKNGDELDQKALKRLQKLSADGKIRARALQWLLNRPHSTREFSDYMRRKQADPKLSEKLIAEFSTKGYLSDESYAKWLVELRYRKGKSNRAISAELSAKGISREVASVALGDNSDESARLNELIQKKGNLSRYQGDKQKFIKYLTSQGFSYNDVVQNLDNKT
jgi:regulatory protein